ncbi:hypothetical protein SDC9_209702 [bioreactor metagenome]|uniref:Uncharacterized protein n=1 Tax=bioreactor metagenome TaxID=1076179 RepID=A0A645JEQ8_9ZZZZ
MHQVMVHVFRGIVTINDHPGTHHVKMGLRHIDQSGAIGGVEHRNNMPSGLELIHKISEDRQLFSGIA